MAELNGSSAKKTLNQIPFFVNQEVDKRLFSMYMEDDDEERNDLNLYIQEGDDFSIDIIEQPFHLEYKGLNNGICINLFLRDGYGIYNEEDADYSALIDTNGVEQSAVKRGRIGGDLSAACIRYLKSGSQLKKYVLEQDLLNSFSGLDKEKEGVLVTLQEDTLVFQRVTGKRRPSMFCTSLFGGARMDRPYLDERASALASELFHNDLSFDNLMELAEDGDVDAMGKVAIAFLNGDEDAGVEPDAEKAVFWFRKQAEADDPTGCFNLAIQYLKGEGVEQDFDQALSWMKKAEENGDSDAVEYIPMLEKLSALKAKADQDDTGAMAELAGQLMSVGKSVGDPTEKEFYAKSVELAQKADAANEPGACWVLALAYEHGRGVIENTEKALEYYQKGAELGNPDCQLNLGLCYIEGKKVPEDKVKGFEFCLKAAEQGHGGAMKAVGSCYQFENGVQYDMKKAIYWYEKALEVIDDPELAKKVMIFKTLEDIDDEMDDNGDIDHIPAEDIDKVDEISEESNEDMTEFHKNYTSDLREGEDGAIEEEEIDTSGLPDGYIEAMDMVLMAAEISEKELDSFENGSCEADFRIVISKAESGDAEAKFTAGKYFIANHIGEETERAIRWIREAAEAGVDKAQEYINEHNELFGKDVDLNSKSDRTEGKMDAGEAVGTIVSEKDVLSQKEAEECIEEHNELSGSNVDFNSKADKTKGEMDAGKAVEAFASGKAALAQMKKDDNGNKRFFNVYGDVHDGVDHILNIFMDSAVINNLLMALAHNNLNSSEKNEDEDKEKYIATQVTIDYIDQAIMWVLLIEKEKIKIEVYSRDEKKGFYSPAIEGEWKTTNGSFNITSKMIQEDNNLLYTVAFATLRKHLIAEGVVDQLRKINKYSAAGVLITAVDEDHIAYKIVQDRQRPDLVCSMFLMGEITCRPYLDEMIKGNRASNMSIEEKIKAAEDGEIWAMEALANNYLNGDEVDQDFEESFKWWKRIAETGDATAQFNVGLHFAKGAGTKRDFQKAAEWMRKAAENGDNDAADLVKIYEEAEENLRKAESGDAAAQAEIAKLFTKLGGSLEQFSTDSDYDEAFKWAKKSADQGNPEGLYCLALCYEHGRGTEYNNEKAIEVYKKAADMKHAPSQWNLACEYLRGFSFGHEVEGLILAYESAAQGYELAINGLEQSGNTVKKIIESYEDPERIITLEATQYEGRADRCERMKVGDELTYKLAKDKQGQDALELFFKGGSVGLAYQHSVGKIIALLKMKKIELKVTVRTCIPKSKRGPRARNADVTLNMFLSEIRNETPEECEERLAREAAQNKEAEEKARIESDKRKAEEKRRKEQEKRKQEEDQKKRIILRKKTEAVLEISNLICARDHVIAAVNMDGRIISIGLPEDLQRVVDQWTNMKGVCVNNSKSGNGFVIGLKEDGTVLAAGDQGKGWTNVSSWSDIKQIAIGYHHTVGLKNDGTVIVAREEEKESYSFGSDEGKVKDWKNIKAIAAGTRVTVGLETNGRIRCASPYSSYDNLNNVSQKFLAATFICDMFYAIKENGRVFDYDRFGGRVELPLYWNDVIMLGDIREYRNSNFHAAGVTIDGKIKISDFVSGFDSVSNWENMVWVGFDGARIVGVTEDGYIRVYPESSDTYALREVRLFKNYLTAKQDRKDEMDRKIYEEKLAKRTRLEEKNKEILWEIECLSQNMQEIKGLFKELKKKKIQKRIESFRKELERNNNIIKNLEL